MPKKNFNSIIIFVLMALVSAPAVAVNYSYAGEKQGLEDAVKNLEKELEDERQVNYAILKENSSFKELNKDLEKSLQNKKQSSETMFKEGYLLEKTKKYLEEKLQAENKNARAALEENASLQKANKRLEEKLRAEKNDNVKLMENLKKDKSKLDKENQKIEKQSVLIVEQWRSEKALLNKELGAAYTQSKIYDKAIEAYSKSLEIEPLDAQIHYNLGLLYQRTGADKKKALFHLKRCQVLNPAAANKKDVQYLIKTIDSSD